ncbi:MAG: hypothetical protein E6H06_08205 [Bacteroidetes bacterium]|nr:MAG: hypothetical protein E6H06_08205 [Bacteroidota bacterium]
MKTKITIVAIILMAFIAISATPIAKPSPKTSLKKTSDSFSFIRTHRQGKGGTVTWAFSSSNASGFCVERTNEDPTDPYSVWVDVGDIPCNSSRSYKCHDPNPFPGLINYRVIAFLNDGSTVTSDVSTIKIMSH